MAAVSACSLTAWAQSNGQGSAAPPTKSSVAPPPADLEPGVNTSATQTSSPEPVSTPAPASTPTPKSAPVPKPAQTSTKRAPASASGTALSSGSSATAGAAVASGATNGATTGPATGETGTTAPVRNAPASGSARGTTAAAGTPKPGAPAGKAHDSIELDTTQITGNRELPKVLYIVPWKRSDLGDLVGKPVNSLLDEVLTPVDRDVFKRQNRYYDALKPDDAKDAAGAATGVNEKH
jgi:hypothetical protein